MTGTWATGWQNGDLVTASEYMKSYGSIFDSTLSGSAASFDVSGIVSVYAHLKVVLYARGDTAASQIAVGVRFNGDSGTNYDYEIATGGGSTAAASETFAQTSGQVGTAPAASAGANLFSTTEITIPNYASSANNKSFVAISHNKNGTTTGTMQVQMLGGGWRSTAAINRVTILPASGNFVTGSRLTIYAAGA